MSATRGNPSYSIENESPLGCKPQQQSDSHPFLAPLHLLRELLSGSFVAVAKSPRLAEKRSPWLPIDSRISRARPCGLGAYCMGTVRRAICVASAAFFERGPQRTWRNLRW